LLEVRPLATHDITDVAALLAAAFDDDPAYAYFFPKRATRSRGLTDFSARNLGTHLRHRCTFVGVTGGAIAGTLTVRPPGGIPISAVTMIRDGLLPFAVDNGLGAVARLFRLKGAYDALEAAVSGGARHWLLHMMAVAPVAQGRGVGSELARQVMARTADAAPAERAPAVLTTHQSRNVEFYRRLGFETTDERLVKLDPSHAGHTVWSMRRRR
jgi:ribosomal protein S18 acetylase RimI-like enzyme